ncbi:MAG TPA: ABC transporter permease [Trebonia sp.]|nr:ABC transporter permease [Trebonia sp.]
MTTFLSILIAGVSTGAIYALISLGFTLAFNSSGMLNLLQGGFVVLGGLLTYDGAGSWHLPLAAAIAVATVVTTAIAAAFHLLVLWPNARRLSPQNMLLVLLGGLILLQGGGQQIWGDFAYSMRPFGHLENFTAGGLTIPAQVVWIVGLGVVVCALLTLFLARTNTGRALRAIAQNPAGARAVGLRTGALALLSFAATGLLGALAGAFVLPYLSVSMNDAATYSLIGIIGISLGGFGSYFGAVVGGVVLGIIEALATGYLSSLYGESLELAALIIILVLRPEGLLRGASRVRSDTGEQPGTVHFTERAPRLLGRAVFAALVVVGAVLPLLGFGSELRDINLVGITALALIGMDILMGYLGMVSLGQSAFMAVGGYTAALSVMHLHLPTLLGVVIGVACAVAVAYVFSVVTVRLAPYYLATVSLALVLLAQDLGGELSVTGGTAGLIAIPSLSVGGFAFDTDARFYYLIWGLVALFGFGSFWVLRGRTGRIMKAISFDPVAAASLGVDVRRYRHYALLYASALAGLAGALYAFYLNFLAPSEVGLGESFTLIVATVLGGAGTLLGPMIGGAVFTYLPAISQGFQQWTTVAEGVLVIAVLSLAPSGLLGSALNGIARLRRMTPVRRGEVRVRVPA